MQFKVLIFHGVSARYALADSPTVKRIEVNQKALAITSNKASIDARQLKMEGL